MNDIEVYDVFTPNKSPTYTLIKERYETDRKILIQSIKIGSGIISLSGPSKSGKTVFVEESLGKENIIHIAGSGVDSAEKLWNKVFALIGTPIPTTKEEEKKIINKVGTEGEAGVPLLAKAKLSGEYQSERNANNTFEYLSDHIDLLIKEFKDTDYIIFIDDFHYITKSAQQEIANQIKTAIHHGVKFICASVPYHSEDVIRANPDLRGRMMKFDFGYWSSAHLIDIAKKGFDALNISIGAHHINALAEESAGSPQLMQSLCLHLCLELDITKKD